MTRTTKGKKGPGFEFWSRRPGNRHGGGVGKTYKKITHSIERAKAKQDLRKEPTEPEYDPREYIPPEAEREIEEMMGGTQKSGVGANVKLRRKE